MDLSRFQIGDDLLRKWAQDRLLFEEVENDTSRGRVLALTARIEVELTRILPTKSVRDFAPRIKLARDLNVIDDATFKMIDALRRLRNLAAHEATAFSFSMGILPKDGDELYDDFIAPIRPHFARLRRDQYYRDDMYASGPDGDFALACRVLLYELDATPTYVPPATPMVSIASGDPERWCLLTEADLEQIYQEEREQFWRDQEDEASRMNAEANAELYDES